MQNVIEIEPTGDPASNRPRTGHRSQAPDTRWRVPIGAVALVISPKVVPDGRAEAIRRRYDPLGAVSITAAVLVCVYAISQAPQVGWTATRTVALLGVVAAALLATFFAIETRVDAPLLPMALLRVRSVAGSNAVSFLLGMSLLTFVFLGTLYIQQVLGLSALATGSATLAHGLHLALLVCGLSALVAGHAAHLVMRRTTLTRTDLTGQAPETAIAAAAK